MLPTPSTSHVNYDRVYEPAEDSYLLLDTLSSEAETSFMRARFPPGTGVPIAVEIGIGSGVVLAFLTAHAKHITGRADILTFGVDINEFAAKAAERTILNATAEAKRTSSFPGSFADCIVGDLATTVKPGSVDILIFNPPYVPTESVPEAPSTFTDDESKNFFAHDSHLLSLSTDGGIDGMEITYRLLNQVPEILCERGIAYILLCAGNKPHEVMERIRAWPAMAGCQWRAEKVGSSGKTAGWEKLCVIRISRSIGGVDGDATVEQI
jgi:release factor glutamine methyltransferase